MLAVMDDLTGEYPARALTSVERDALDAARRQRWRACGMGLAASQLAAEAIEHLDRHRSQLFDY
jgi:hypothetical protein